MRDFRGTVIAEMAVAVSHAVFVYKIINFADPCVLFWVAHKCMDADGGAVVDRFRLRHHFRCTSSIDIEERSVGD
jgi:hypothetical protein